MSIEKIYDFMNCKNGTFSAILPAFRVCIVPRGCTLIGYQKYWVMLIDYLLVIYLDKGEAEDHRITILLDN